MVCVFLAMQSKTKFVDLSGCSLGDEATIRLLTGAVSVNPAIQGLKLDGTCACLYACSAARRAGDRAAAAVDAQHVHSPTQRLALVHHRL